MNLDRITINPEVRSGKPCIKGACIMVYDILEYLSSNMTEEEVLEDFPSLTRADLKTCIVFAAEREQRLATVTSTA